MFFLWFEHEADAKERLKTSQLAAVPQTPTKTSANSAGLVLATPGSRGSPQAPETPFTKAKRKRVPTSTTKHDDHSDSSKLDHSAQALGDPFTDPRRSPESQPVRKAARTCPTSTPSQPFTDKLKRVAAALPTPTTGDHASKSNAAAPNPPLLQQPPDSPSPTFGRLNHHRQRGSSDAGNEPDLTARVLQLIRSGGHELKFSTEMRLRHEIGLALDAGESKLRRCEETISGLWKRIDELETMVLNLVGDE
jgi:hypothetical protein